jgi:MoxR-like ATPase
VSGRSVVVATRCALDLMLRDGEPLVVESPPGAGKTELVEAVAATAATHGGLRVAVVAPRAQQM